MENARDEHGNPKFGINPWPEKRYGEFYAGDSYIVLQTKEDEESGSLLYDIYFWIGSESSQDEYGVAAYKANELDDLLDDAPVQHREVQYHESNSFMKCFQNRIKYLDGGIDGGFREIDDSYSAVAIPIRMYHVRRDNRVTRCIQVPAKCDSLNQGDAFILQTESMVYTWFGDACSPFEKSKAAEIAHNIVSALNGQAKLVEEVGDDDDDFWSAIGGKGNIKPADEYSPVDFVEKTKTKMSVLSEVDSVLNVQDCEAKRSNLATNDVCLIDTGSVIFVWIGSGSTKREQSQAMLMTQKHIKALNREGKTNVVRVKEGQEARVTGFQDAL